MPDSKYTSLRSQMLYATRPGKWVIGDPSGHPYVTLADDPHQLPIISAKLTNYGKAVLHGFTELIYAASAANAVPNLLKERDVLLADLTNLREYINMAAAHKMGEPPMNYNELVTSIMNKLDRLLNKLEE